MWFRMLKLTVEDTNEGPNENDLSDFETSPRVDSSSKGKKRAKIFSIPAEPSDFQRVRLKRILSPLRSPRPASLTSTAVSLFVIFASTGSRGIRGSCALNLFEPTLDGLMSQIIVDESLLLKHGKPIE